MSERAAILHAAPWQGVFYITGGGALLIADLLTTPGASGTVLEVQVPYAEAALAGLLGRRPDQACSAATARALAMAAFQRARTLASAGASGDTPRPLFGMACTASLATGRPKRGAHRAHIALQTADATYDAQVVFDGDRETEERELLDMLWHALAQTLDLPLEVTVPTRPMIAHTAAQRNWRELILGEILAAPSQPHDGRLLMPGAFNPLHRAHERMLAIAEARTGLVGAFELSIVNVDKPLLDYTEIDQRLRQFGKPVWLTRLPTFIEKARYFPGSTFVVGADTLARIVEPRYYAGVAGRDAALAELAELGTRFVVFGRTIDAEFRTLDDLDLPESIRALCIGIGAAEFSDPLSSTELRRRG
jgi:nicotinamide mononucleotide (NMN) deamidase PncC